VAKLPINLIENLKFVARVNSKRFAHTLGCIFFGGATEDSKSVILSPTCAKVFCGLFYTTASFLALSFPSLWARAILVGSDLDIRRTGLRTCVAGIRNTVALTVNDHESRTHELEDSSFSSAPQYVRIQIIKTWGASSSYLYTLWHGNDECLHWTREPKEASVMVTWACNATKILGQECFVHGCTCQK